MKRSSLKPLVQLLCPSLDKVLLQVGGSACFEIWQVAEEECRDIQVGAADVDHVAGVANILGNDNSAGDEKDVAKEAKCDAQPLFLHEDLKWAEDAHFPIRLIKGSQLII